MSTIKDLMKVLKSEKAKSIFSEMLGSINLDSDMNLLTVDELKKIIKHIDEKTDLHVIKENNPIYKELIDIHSAKQAQQMQQQLQAEHKPYLMAKSIPKKPDFVLERSLDHKDDKSLIARTLRDKDSKEINWEGIHKMLASGHGLEGVDKLEVRDMVKVFPKLLNDPIGHQLMKNNGFASNILHHVFADQEVKAENVLSAAKWNYDTTTISLRKRVAACLLGHGITLPPAVVNKRPGNLNVELYEMHEIYRKYYDQMLNKTKYGERIEEFTQEYIKEGIQPSEIPKQAAIDLLEGLIYTATRKRDEGTITHINIRGVVDELNQAKTPAEWYEIITRKIASYLVAFGKKECDYKVVGLDSIRAYLKGKTLNDRLDGSYLTRLMYIRDFIFKPLLEEGLNKQQDYKVASAETKPSAPDFHG